MGFQPQVYRLTRMDGPRWSHEVDEHVAAIVAGLNPEGLPLREVVSMYAAAHNISNVDAMRTEDFNNNDDELLRQAVGVIADLVRHGLVIPAELVDD